MFRYNNRKMDDGDRFNIVVREIVGKRLTWDQLTGADRRTGNVPRAVLNGRGVENVTIRVNFGACRTVNRVEDELVSPHWCHHCDMIQRFG